MIPKTTARMLFAGALLALGLAAPPALAAPATVIDLTQTACQFVESENGVDHGYSTASKADCQVVNADSGAARLAGAQALTLAPGKYIFRVTNQNVPYELGFWLRGDGLINRATLPSISGGGLTRGATRDYEIVLEPGDYLYSCPLNPTPDYKLVVEG